MEKPIVNLVEDQQIETNSVEVSGYEAEQLLLKYGFKPNQFSTRQEDVKQDNGLTFEDMIAQQELKQKEEENRRRNKMCGPRPTTFDGYDSEVKYESDGDTGFGFKIEIITDMKLPRY